MKKFFIAFALLLCLPLSIFADEKVKVYVFEAGGCPWCEEEINYLKGLDSYNKKFEIITKEAFIDHIDWEEGKDFQLGYNTAEAFTNAGLPTELDATPFVVISDLYASTGYNPDLESIIDQAYEEGDKDVVACVEAGNDNCVEAVANTSSNAYSGNSEGTTTTEKVIYILVIIICFIVLILMSFYIIKPKNIKKSHKEKNNK